MAESSLESIQNRKIAIEQMRSKVFRIIETFLKEYDSVHTRRAYKNDLGTFVMFLDQTLPGETILTVNRDHMADYKECLEKSTDSAKKKLANKTINRKLTSIRAFFQYLCERSILEDNPAQFVKLIKSNKAVSTNDLSDEQVRELFDSIRLETPAGYMHKALLYTLFCTGMRRSEIVSLKYGDLNLVKGNYLLEYYAKGKKKMIKVLPEPCMKVILEYLDECKNRGVVHNSTDPLFLPTNKKKDGLEIRPLNGDTVYKMIKKYCEKIGITTKVSTHSARATYIGSALENGSGIYQVANDVGHEDINLTREYDKRRRLVKDSPANNLGFLD